MPDIFSHPSPHPMWSSFDLICLRLQAPLSSIQKKPNLITTADGYINGCTAHKQNSSRSETQTNQGSPRS